MAVWTPFVCNCELVDAVALENKCRALMVQRCGVWCEAVCLFENKNERLSEETSARWLCIDKYEDLVCCFELFEEAQVVFREHTQILNLIFEVCDSLHAHAEGVSLVGFAVNSVEFENIWMNHAASEDFNPARVLAE